jgi:alkane 1-monooxygenase
VLYMHFRIAHVHGHHVRAATRADPASARLGEGLYAFLIRSVGGQVREAWQFEAERRRRVAGAGNRLIAYFGVEALFLVAIALYDLRALVFVVGVAVIAVALLESFNYIAHYGLTRRVGPEGRMERLAAHHSWNSTKRMNNAALFNMGRHSDHHRHMVRSYEELEALSGCAELPSGYAAALLMALLPTLWRRVMDPRAKAVMAARPVHSIN